MSTILKAPALEARGVEPAAADLLKEIDELKARVRELEFIVEHAPIGIVAVDSGMRYRGLNGKLSALNERPVGDHIGRTIREVMPRNADVLEPIYREVLETGKPIEGREIALSDRRGGRRECLAAYYPLRSGDRLTGVCGFVQDVTAERAAERAIRDSAARYRFLAESLPLLVWTSDAAGTISYRNRFLAEYTGRSIEEVNATGMAPVVHPEDLASLVQATTDGYRGIQAFSFEARVRRHSDGEYRWFLGKATPFEVADDGTREWLGVAFDIDDRKRAEQMRARLASIVESSADAIIGMDCGGRITSWNPGAANLFGYTFEEVAGKRFTFLTEDVGGEGIGEGHTRETMARVCGGEKIERYETVYSPRLGRELTVLAAITPVRDEHGHVTGAFRTVRDVTEQRRVQLRLAAADERVRIVQRAVKAGTWEVDLKTGTVWRSPELHELYGIDPAGPWVATFHPDDEAMVHRTFQAAINAHRQLRVQYRILRHGQLRWLAGFGNVVEGVDGGPPRMVGITIDTTEIRRTEETVRQTAHLEGIGRLAGGVAHDFNNLLAGIMGGASFIDDMLPEDHAARGMLDLVIRSSERAAHLTRQLLAYAGKGTFTLRKTDLSKTVQDAFVLLRGSIPMNVELVVQTGWELPLIEADSNQLSDIVLNLVTNAAEAIGEKEGVVRVRTGIERLDRDAVERRFGEHSIGHQAVSPGQWVYLEVDDTGEGIPADMRQRIFEPFFTTKFTGRGLGLSAVEGIVRAHKGGIEVISSPGKGATFRILFPVAEPHVAEAAARGPHRILAGDSPAGGREVVLVIDDEEAVRNIVRASLERAGYLVLLASDGETGLGMFRERREQVALVILDVSMPKMGGSAVHDAFVKEGIEVPVLITSGYPEPEAMQRIAPAKVAGFIQKPFSVRELSVQVDKLIHSAKRVE